MIETRVVLQRAHGLGAGGAAGRRGGRAPAAAGHVHGAAHGQGARHRQRVSRAAGAAAPQPHPVSAAPHLGRPRGRALISRWTCRRSQFAECGGGERTSVELAVAPHLPLLHQALLHDPAARAQHERPPPSPAGKEGPGGAVGAARVQVAALLAALASSEVEEVCTTMLTLGTPLL